MLLSHLPAPATPRPPAPGGTVLDWFSHWARVRPHAPAVLTPEACWDYAAVDGLSSELAARLREHLAPGDVVGVLLPRSVTLVVTALALAKVGATYLPLGENPRKSAARASSRPPRPAISSPPPTTPTSAATPSSGTPSPARRWP